MVEKRNKKRELLYQAYLEASYDVEREKDLNDWDGISVESWEPEDINAAH